MTNFNNPALVDSLVGLWDFRSGATSSDTGLADGIAQNGTFEGHASASGGQLRTDGDKDFFDVDGDDAPFQALGTGTIEAQFTQTHHIGSSPDTIVNRGEECDAHSEGHFDMRVTHDGRVQVEHEMPGSGAHITLSTAADFFETGQTVNVVYSWDETSGATIEVTNVTTGASYTQSVAATGLTMDIGDDDDENFTFGAREYDDGKYDHYFKGAIDYVAVYNKDILNEAPDYIVEGTSGGDLIDLAYTGDPEGDRIDALDNDLTPPNNDDVVQAFEGNDTVKAGEGDDTVYGGTGNDTIFGQEGDDLLLGEMDDDRIEGGDGADTLLGNQGDDLIYGNGNDDLILGGEGNDTLFGDGGSGEGADDRFPDWPQDISNVVFYFDTDGDDVYDVAVKVDHFPDDSSPTFISNDLDDYYDQMLTFVQVNNPELDGLEPVLGVSIKGGVQPTQFYAVDGNGNGPLPDGGPTLNTGPGPDQELSYADFFAGYDPHADAGSGTDLPGDDLIYGGGGDDLIYGNAGNDTLYGDDVAEGTPIGPNLILNGSFENTAGLTTTGYGFVGEGAIPYWTSSVDGAEIDVHNDDRGGVLPTDGDNWLDLEASPGNSRVGQDVGGVEDGKTYLLTFDAGDKSDEPQSGTGENLVEVYWGGELIATIDPAPGTMTEYSFDLVGGAGDGSNRLEFRGTGDEDNFGASIDSVSLVELAGDGSDAGNDTIEGGDGNDFIAGNDGSDVLKGDAGNDTIIGGAGDTITGGSGADSILIDPTELDKDGNSSTGVRVDGSTEGDDRDTLNLTQFVSYTNLVETTDPDGDSISGTVDVLDAEGNTRTITFSEIETLLLPPPGIAPDGVVDGEETGELMGPGYDDSNAPTNGGGDQIDGTDGDNDSIRGNGGNDTINAGLGDDTVDGGSGDDSIQGGLGDDILIGGSGDDTLRGNDGDDTLDGGIGEDELAGGSGNDSLSGGAENDTLDGGSGNDTLDGGAGDDILTGGSGNDSITDLDGDTTVTSGPAGLPDRGFPFFGNADANPFDDRDTVTTGDGDDSITTGDDNDVISSGGGDDTIDAGFDDDLVNSGSGDDLITLGEGSDTAHGGDGDDTIYGGLGPDVPDGANIIDVNEYGRPNDPILDNGDDLIYAGAGDDLVYGEDDNDTIYGGSGDDTLDGGIDDDEIFGEAGDDLLVGGQGADLVDGGLGNDTILVGVFDDPANPGDLYVEGIGDTIIGGEDPGDGDVDTLDLTGNKDFSILFEDSIDPTGTSGESGRVIYYTDDTKTVEKGQLVFKEIENVIPCFTPGTLIATPRGEVPVERLRVGDRILTRDNGIQEIRWTGSRTLMRSELAEAPEMKPILIKAGALGRGLPERDTVVSPQHRMLVAGANTQLYFEESEVLVAAKHLVGRWGVSTLETLRTTYIHFMFDRHEVVLSNGSWTESFQPGDQSLGGMGQDSRDEIFALFPELATEEGLTDYAAARRSLKAHEARLLQL